MSRSLPTVGGLSGRVLTLHHHCHRTHVDVVPMPYPPPIWAKLRVLQGFDSVFRGEFPIGSASLRLVVI